MNDAVLYKKLAVLPESMKSEVADFIDFLMNKAKKNHYQPTKSLFCQKIG
jgi:hypothetical protein